MLLGGTVLWLARRGRDSHANKHRVGIGILELRGGWGARYRANRINSPCRDAAWSNGLRVPACVGWPAWLGRRRFWAGGLLGAVCGLIGTGSGQGRVRPMGHVTRRGIRPRTTRRMAWSGQAVGR